MRVNLLPTQYQPEPLFDSKRIFLVAFISFLVVCVILGNVYFYLQLKYAKENLGAVTQQREALQTEKLKVDALENRIAEIQKTIDNVMSIKKSYPNYVTYLNTFADSLTAEVWLRNVNFSSGNVSLEGSSMSFSLIGDLLKNLGQKDFTFVRLSRISEQKKDDLKSYEYSIDIQIKERGAAYVQ